MNFKNYVLLVLGIFVFTISSAQVTIGSQIKPEQGALLDLKETDSKDANSTRGLLLPRVALENEKELAPTVKGITSQKTKAEHAGLVVYNTTNAAPKLCPGLYYWNAEEWVRFYGSCQENYDFDIDITGLKEGNNTAQKGNLVAAEGIIQVLKVTAKGSWHIRVEGDIMAPDWDKDTQSATQKQLFKVTPTPASGAGSPNAVEVKFEFNTIRAESKAKTQIYPIKIIFVNDVSGAETAITRNVEQVWVEVTGNRNALSSFSDATTKADPNDLQAMVFDVDGYYTEDLAVVDFSAFSNVPVPFTLTGFDPTWIDYKDNIMDVAICNELVELSKPNTRSCMAKATNGYISLNLYIAQNKLTFKTDELGPINFTNAATAATKDFGLTVTRTTRRSVNIKTNPNASWVVLDHSINETPKVGVLENTGAARNAFVEISLSGTVLKKKTVADKVLPQIEIKQAAKAIDEKIKITPQSSYVTDGLTKSFTIEATGGWTLSLSDPSSLVQGGFSTTSGSGNATVTFSTNVISTNNTSSAEYIYATITATSTSGTVVEKASLRGEKMYISTPSSIVADADGYINGYATMTFSATSNSTRPITYRYPTLANATNNVINVQPTVSKTNSSTQYIEVSNSAMTKQVAISQSGLVFSAAYSVSLDSDGNYKSLGLNKSTRRTSNVTLSDNSWMRVTNATTTYPSVGATANTGAQRSGRATISLSGSVPSKNSTSATSVSVIVNQDKKEIPQPQGLRFWVHNGFGEYYLGDNTTGMFSFNIQLRSLVFIVTGTVNGESINAKYYNHTPNNPAVIKNIGTMSKSGLPMFDINGSCQVNLKDQFGNIYTFYIY